MAKRKPCKSATTATAAAAAQMQRIEELRARIRALPGGAILGGCADCPPEVEEKFLRHMLFMEEEPSIPLRDQLEARGVRLLEPAILDDQQLGPVLWQLIDDLARVGVFLSSTDHLSDRQLYEWLWHDQLPQPFNLDEDGDGSWHVDVIGGCSEEDQQIYMKYYADDETRDMWRDDFPNEPMPERATPPFDRDQHLPQQRPRK